MPRYFKVNAIPALLLELEDYIKGAVACARNERGDSHSVVTQVNDMFAQVHEILDGHVPTPTGFYIKALDGQSQPIEPTVRKQGEIVSIQVQCTRLTGGGVSVVPKADNTATHWSVYLRHPDGTAEWVEDFLIDPKSSGRAYSNAIHAAAKLSMTYQAYIEQVQ